MIQVLYLYKAIRHITPCIGTTQLLDDTTRRLPQDASRYCRLPYKVTITAGFNEWLTGLDCILPDGKRKCGNFVTTAAIYCNRYIATGISFGVLRRHPNNTCNSFECTPWQYYVPHLQPRSASTLDQYGHGRSHRCASARGGEVPLYSYDISRRFVPRAVRPQGRIY